MKHLSYSQKKKYQMIKSSSFTEEEDNIYTDTALLAEHYMCAQLTVESYRQPLTDIDNFPSEFGVKIFIHQEAEIKCPAFYIAQNVQKKEMYIVVRGTKHPKDIFADGDGTVVDLFGSESHGGFVNSGKNVLKLIPKEILLNAMNEGYKFYFTGHSLGGAVAAVLYISFKKNWPKLSGKCVTFGCPGLLLPEFNDEWKDPNDKCIDSIFHVGDPIPFSCNHNILATNKTKLEFIQNITKVLTDKSEYFPLSFLNVKSHEDTSDKYDLLVPPGRLFAIGIGLNGIVQIKPYEGSYEYFNGFQPFLTQACHACLFYMSSMSWFVEKSKIDELLAIPVNLPPDFFPAMPISA